MPAAAEEVSAAVTLFCDSAKDFRALDLREGGVEKTLLLERAPPGRARLMPRTSATVALDMGTAGPRKHHVGEVNREIGISSTGSGLRILRPNSLRCRSFTDSPYQKERIFHAAPACLRSELLATRRRIVGCVLSQEISSGPQCAP